MTQRQLRIDKFSFVIEKDLTADPLSAIEVWVFFNSEPCCDANGHQYRFYLPVGIKKETLDDMCFAFTRAVHCEQFATAA